MKKRISLGVLAIIILVLGLVGAVVYYNLGFRQRAEVVPVAIVKVFFDEAQTDELEQGEMIDWGEVHSGNNTMPLWINNTGSVAALLGFNYDQQQLEGWGWTESWNYTGDPLASGATVVVEITLELPGDVGAGVYEWDSGITAWAAP